MSKKISEIAKELDVKPGVVMTKLRQLGIDVSSIASQISPEDQSKFMESMGKGKGITTRKVTKVSNSGNVVSKKKAIIKAQPKSGSQKEKSKYIVGDNSSDLMSGMVRDGKKAPKVVQKVEKTEVKPKVVKKATPKPIAKPKLKVTVIKKHHHEEIHEEPQVAVAPVEVAVSTESIKPNVKKEEVNTETTVKVEKPEKTIKVEKPERTIKVVKKPVKETEIKIQAKNDQPLKTTERKLGLTGRKIDLTPPRRPEPSKSRPKPNSTYTNRPFNRNTNTNTNSSTGTGRNTTPRPGTRPGARPGARPGQRTNDSRNDKPDKPVVKEKTRINKKVAKITYKKSANISGKSDTNKKTTTGRTSYTNTKSNKYRKNRFVGGGMRNVNEVLSEDFILNEYYSDDNIRIRRSKRKGDLNPRKEILSKVKLPEMMTVKFFAEKIKKQNSDVILKLMSLDIMASVNDEIDFDTALLVADEYKILAELEATVTEEDILFDDDVKDSEESLVSRAPVVVVMGHVDHGKTSLLDTIKNTDVVATEAGAITQHVGAYSVHIKDRIITFLDTPGHEAFTAIRRRGAQVTDIAIIVVAADDGIMPQTVEALNHAKDAGVSIMVAINKIDLPAANPERVKQELTEHGVVPEEWGGDVICVPVSAKTGENIENLLDMVLLTADMLELKANPDRQAKGTVIESKLDAHKGVMATVLIQNGSLRPGDCIISGTAVGRVRAMTDDKGEVLDVAGPSTPVVVLGLDEVPGAGEAFYSVEDEKTARNLADRRRFDRQQLRTLRKPATLEELFEQIQEGSVKELKVIVKGDVRGSVEAVTESLEKLSNEEVTVKVIHGAAGTISESDISLAEVSGAIVIGFNVRPGNNVTQAAKEAGVDVRLYRIIYKAVEDVEFAMKGMLDPKFEEVITGHAEIRQIYKASGVGTIAGCMVTDGNIKRNSDIRVVRDGIIVYEGKLASLKRFQDDAKEVQSGFECGLSVEKYNDIKENDVIEGFEMVEIKV
ncbi:MAG: translation initiation factor IF-2 [Clostridiales bacterium]|nr:translation initiation factor IF-2 [Clostridiales bacterium]